MNSAHARDFPVTNSTRVAEFSEGSRFTRASLSTPLSRWRAQQQGEAGQPQGLSSALWGAHALESTKADQQAYTQAMLVGYAAVEQGDYHTALINFRAGFSRATGR